MLLNYIKTSLKSFRANKLATLINLVGLAIALCICLLVLLYVRFETGYDSYNVNVRDIYRLVTDVKTGTATDYRTAAAPMGPAMQAAFPEVKAQTRLFLDNLLIQKDEQAFGDEEIAYADSTLFTVFTLPLVSGNPATVFSKPFNTVLSETAAKKYFGSTDAVGKTLIVDGTQPAVVTGIMKDMPANSQLRVDILFSMQTLLQVFNPSRANDWTKFGCNTYLLLQPGTNAARIKAKLPAFVKQHIDDKSSQYNLQLEPLQSVYLHGKPRGWRTGSIVTGNITNVYIFIFTAVLVLVIACINFINLATAISLKRAKQIAVRKVVGAGKTQLLLQFLSDAVLLSLIAAVLALLLGQLLLPVFNTIAGKVIATSVLQSPLYIGWLTGIAIVTGLAAGIYPALHLSALNPVKHLKASYYRGGKGALLRKVLVTAQFSLSIILVIATLVVLAQVNYMQHKQPGFDKDQALAIDYHFDGRVFENHETFRQQLLNVPGVTAASYSSCIPGKATVKMLTGIVNANGSLQQADMDAYSIDNAFLQQYSIPVIAGRGFLANSAQDSSSALLLNETAVKALGYKTLADVIGKPFTQAGFNHDDGYTGTVIGVVKDFHYQSLKEAIEPLTINMYQWRYTYLNLTLSHTNLPATINALQKKWAQLAPGLPMSYVFTDDAFNAQYVAEERFVTLFTAFAVVAIILSCLGLFGLCAFSAASRSKETGIRKVLGATGYNIVALLSKDFLQPVALAMLIACPLAWFAMHSWLQHYAYHTVISWQYFVMAGVAVTGISVVTISYHTIKASLVNPALILKTE